MQYKKIKKYVLLEKINHIVEQPQIYTDIYSSPTTALFKHSGYMNLQGSLNKSVSNLIQDFGTTKYIEHK